MFALSTRYTGLVQLAFVLIIHAMIIYLFCKVQECLAAFGMLDVFGRPGRALGRLLASWAPRAYFFEARVQLCLPPNPPNPTTWWLLLLNTAIFLARSGREHLREHNIVLVVLI